MSILSYADRVAAINKPGDEERQLELAKRRVLALRYQKRTAPSLEKKLRADRCLRHAEQVLRQLRVNIFVLEDLAAARSTGDTDRIAELESKAGL